MGAPGGAEPPVRWKMTGRGWPGNARSEAAARNELEQRVNGPLKPELLVCEPQRNGRLPLVAVEFIVPFTAWTAPEPPSVHGLSFHRNEVFRLWVIHAWIGKNNPAGTFTDWNPEVACRFAK